MSYTDPYYYYVYAVFAPWPDCATRRFCIDVLPRIPKPTRPLMRLWRSQAWRSVVACQVWEDCLL